MSQTHCGDLSSIRWVDAWIIRSCVSYYGSSWGWICSQAPYGLVFLGLFTGVSTCFTAAVTADSSPFCSPFPPSSELFSPPLSAEVWSGSSFLFCVEIKHTDVSFCVCLWCCTASVYIVLCVFMSYSECKCARQCLTLKLIFRVLVCMVWSGSGVSLGGLDVSSAPDTDSGSGSGSGGDGSSAACTSSRGESTPGGAISSALKSSGFSQLDSAHETNRFRQKSLTHEITVRKI